MSHCVLLISVCMCVQTPMFFCWLILTSAGHMTSIPQNSLFFKRTRKNSLWSSLLPSPDPTHHLPCFLTNSLMCSCFHWPYLAFPAGGGWVGWVCGVQKLWSKATTFCFPPSQLTSAACGPLSPMENKSGVRFYVAFHAGLRQGVTLHVSSTVLFIPPVFICL